MLHDKTYMHALVWICGSLDHFSMTPISIICVTLWLYKGKTVQNEYVICLTLGYPRKECGESHRLELFLNSPPPLKLKYILPSHLHKLKCKNPPLKIELSESPSTPSPK